MPVYLSEFAYESLYNLGLYLIRLSKALRSQEAERIVLALSDQDIEDLVTTCELELNEICNDNTEYETSQTGVDTDFRPKNLKKRLEEKRMDHPSPVVIRAAVLIASCEWAWEFWAQRKKYSRKYLYEKVGCDVIKSASREFERLFTRDKTWSYYSESFFDSRPRTSAYVIAPDDRNARLSDFDLKVIDRWVELWDWTAEPLCYGSPCWINDAIELRCPSKKPALKARR